MGIYPRDFIDSASGNRTGPGPQGPGDGCGSTGRGVGVYYFATPRNFPICSFKNFSSAGLPPAPAVCPHKDGMGISETFGMNPDSYRASPTGKYRSVSDGI